LKDSNSSASSGILANQQNQSIVSEYLNNKSAVSEDYANKSSLLQSDQSATNQKDDDMEQLNPEAEVLQFSENTATDNKSI
jgi:hypothetical protein